MEKTTTKEGKKLYFSIMDEGSASEYNPIGERPILIRCYYNHLCKIEHIDKFIDVLELKFAEGTLEDIEKNKDIVFNEKMAIELNKFILKNDFDEIVIHCSAGAARSPAIGMCVARILGLKELEKTIVRSGGFIPDFITLFVFAKTNIMVKECFKDSDVIIRNPDRFSEKINIDALALMGETESDEIKSREKRKEIYAKIWGLKF